MISPFTKPGTEVVCVNSVPPADALPGVASGCVYTVGAIFPGKGDDAEKFGVVLREHGFGNRVYNPPWWAFWRSSEENKVGYNIANFRYFNLAGLDDLLTEKHDLPLELERA